MERVWKPNRREYFLHYHRCNNGQGKDSYMTTFWINLVFFSLLAYDFFIHNTFPPFLRQNWTVDGETVSLFDIGCRTPALASDEHSPTLAHTCNKYTADTNQWALTKDGKDAAWGLTTPSTISTALPRSVPLVIHDTNIGHNMSMLQP